MNSSDVPASLPGLMRTQKSIRREWQAKSEKHSFEEVLGSIRAAVNCLEKERGEAQLGDVLEALCAAAHVMDLDAETALRSSLMRRIERLREEDKKA